MEMLPPSLSWNKDELKKEVGKDREACKASVKEQSLPGRTIKEKTAFEADKEK